MNLENIETKEPLIKKFFSWLFDDEKIINKDVTLEKEIDFSLAPYYMDANIYYPKQIANFFNTTAMQRLGRISQLDLAIDEFPNLYHNRLQHSKGVYYRKLEELLHNFENPSWRKYIEDNNMKLYILAELIKVAGHDIGHLPLSHAFEQIIFSCRGPHETLGKRILLEDLEIQSLLTSISTDLPHVLEELYEKPILNFNTHDESNYDVDRFDYIVRDNLYAGIPVYLPYLHYETIPITIDNLGIPKTNIDGSISPCADSSSTIDVYDYSSLHHIEHFLEIREAGYKNIYFSSNTHVREHSIDALLKAFISSDSQSGKELRDFVTFLQSCDINTIDLNQFLEWDDLKFYSQILDIAEKHENIDIRLLAAMTIPSLKAFLTMIYSHLNMYNKGQIYSKEDKEFIKKIKTIIQGKNSLSENLKNKNFAMDNTLIFPHDKPLPIDYKKYLDNGLINSSNFKIRAYNPQEPIYIKGANGKIYELSHHPDRKCDWDIRTDSVQTIYSYIPFLRLNGVPEEEIQEILTFCKTNNTFKNSNNTNSSINMQPLEVGHNIEDCFLEL